MYALLAVLGDARGFRVAWQGPIASWFLMRAAMRAMDSMEDDDSDPESLVSGSLESTPGYASSGRSSAPSDGRTSASSEGTDELAPEPPVSSSSGSTPVVSTPGASGKAPRAGVRTGRSRRPPLDDGSSAPSNGTEGSAKEGCESRDLL